MSSAKGGDRQQSDLPSNVVVMKFGGTSVEDADAIRSVARIVKLRLRYRPVVVVSALAGVTDQLLNAAQAAARGQWAAAAEALERLRDRHGSLAAELVTGDGLRELSEELSARFEILTDVWRGIAALAELSPRSEDYVLGFGECLSARIVSAALAEAGLKVSLVNARECIITDPVHTRATPLWDETNRRLSQRLGHLLREEKIPLLAGYIAATRDGVPTTLGRGGSDFTASIVGAALHARCIEIWTDVDGVLSADPALCADAQCIETMSFDEAAELAYFGARVLHPATLQPAMRKNIPVHVLNSRNPEGPGTRIVARGGGQAGVKAITTKRGIAVVDVEAVRWLAPELLREVCEVFERHCHGVDVVSASRSSLSLLVNSTSALPAIAEELKGLATMRWQNHKALICLVGEGVRRQPAVASRVFGSMQDVDFRLICQGASERNISFLVDESRAEDLVRRLHRLFFQSRFDPYS